MILFFSVLSQEEHVMCICKYLGFLFHFYNFDAVWTHKSKKETTWRILNFFPLINKHLEIQNQINVLKFFIITQFMEMKTFLRNSNQLFRYGHKILSNILLHIIIVWTPEIYTLLKWLIESRDFNSRLNPNQFGRHRQICVIDSSNDMIPVQLYIYRKLDFKSMIKKI